MRKLQKVMGELKALGTAQNVKVYRRHGADGDLFGVSFANLNKLAKKIGTDHALAQELWATGNLDARTLATLIADPGAMSAKELDAWARSIDYYPLADYFVRKLVSRSDHALSRTQAWTKSPIEFVQRCGFMVTACLAVDKNDLSDDTFVPCMALIEKSIHKAKNRAREGMNGALIAIGRRSEPLRKQALAIARRIGPVEIDHGETSCKTPDATVWLSADSPKKRPGCR